MDNNMDEEKYLGENISLSLVAFLVAKDYPFIYKNKHELNLNLFSIKNDYLIENSIGITKNEIFLVSSFKMKGIKEKELSLEINNLNILMTDYNVFFYKEKNEYSIFLKKKVPFSIDNLSFNFWEILLQSHIIYMSAVINYFLCDLKEKMSFQDSQKFFFLYCETLMKIEDKKIEEQNNKDNNIPEYKNYLNKLSKFELQEEINNLIDILNDFKNEESNNLIKRKLKIISKLI